MLRGLVSYAIDFVICMAILVFVSAPMTLELSKPSREHLPVVLYAEIEALAGDGRSLHLPVAATTVALVP